MTLLEFGAAVHELLPDDTTAVEVILWHRRGSQDPVFSAWSMANGLPARCPDNTKPYAVLFFGSHPDLENDDCWYGHDFDTLEEALADFQKLPHDPSVEWIMLDGAEGPNGDNLMRRNPSFRRSRDDGEWQREHAMQAGMAFGCDGYNDALEDFS